MVATSFDQMVQELQSSKEFFDRATRALEEKDSAFVPAEGMMSAAQQVAHVAQTLDWFREGASRPEGFDMDFENHMKKVMAIKSLAEARNWHDAAHGTFMAWVAELGEDGVNAAIADGPIMGGMPRTAVIYGVIDHTAHHRGALGVYTRLLGKTPPMPYMD